MILVRIKSAGPTILRSTWLSAKQNAPHYIRTIFLENLLESGDNLRYLPAQNSSFWPLHIYKVIWVGGMGEFIQVDESVFWVFRDKQTQKVRTNKSRSASNQNPHQHPPLDLRSCKYSTHGILPGRQQPPDSLPERGGSRIEFLGLLAGRGNSALDTRDDSYINTF